MWNTQLKICRTKRCGRPSPCCAWNCCTLSSPVPRLVALTHSFDGGALYPFDRPPSCFPLFPTSGSCPEPNLSSPDSSPRGHFIPPPITQRPTRLLSFPIVHPAFLNFRFLVRRMRYFVDGWTDEVCGAACYFPSLVYAYFFLRPLHQPQIVAPIAPG